MSRVEPSLQAEMHLDDMEKDIEKTKSTESWVNFSGHWSSRYCCRSSLLTTVWVFDGYIVCLVCVGAKVNIESAEEQTIADARSNAFK